MAEVSVNVDDLSPDPDIALEQTLWHFDQDTDEFWDKDKFVGLASTYFDIAAEYLAMFEKILERYDAIDTPEPPDADEFRNITISTRRIDSFIAEIRNFLEPRKLQRSISEKRKKYASRFSGTEYTFTDNQLEKAQRLIYEIRDIIRKSDKLDESHKRRILQQLNNLQDAFDKKVSDLTTLYGHIVKLGKTFGKFGEESKPLVDRMRELAGIVEQSQGDAEGLPKPSQDQSLLGASGNSNDDESTES